MLIKIKQHLQESAAVKAKTIGQCSKSIQEAVNLIIQTFNQGNKIMVCGNGGSAADSQHFVGEFVCLLNKDFKRPALPAIALTTDSSILTAYSNDFGFNKVFTRQVQALGKPGDLLVGISTSGNSKNIIQAIKQARLLKIKTLVLTGQKGVLKDLADIAIAVPSDQTQYIQETHICIEHILCQLVEESLFNLKK